MSKKTFLILSAISGFVELGCFWFGLVNFGGNIQAFLFILAYQLGNLIANMRKHIIVGRGTWLDRAANSLAIVFIGWLVFENVQFKTMSSLITFLTFMTVSLVIQVLRKPLKTDGVTKQKRLFRIGGFVLSPLIIFPESIYLLLLIMVAAITVILYHTFLQNEVKFNEI